MKRDEFLKLLLDESSYYDIEPKRLVDIYYKNTLKPLDLTPPSPDRNILIYGLRCPWSHLVCFVGVSYEPMKDYRKEEQTFGYTAPALAAWEAFLKERYHKPVPVVLQWTWPDAAKIFFNNAVVTAKHGENPYLINQFISNEGFFMLPSSSESDGHKTTSRKGKAAAK